MFTRILIVFLLLFTHLAMAQDVQWASEVIEFSSELTPVQYSARQALRKPNVLPLGGESPNAWTPSKPGNEEFIKVGFEKPMKIQQIAIAESYNPSAVYQVFTYDKDNKEYLINTFTPKPVGVKARFLNVFFALTDYEVRAIKIVLDGGAIPGYASIDAIGISNSNTPIEASINVAENINEDIFSERLTENVNSSYPELRPLISPDGNTLYFSRKYHPENIGGANDQEDIWYSQRDPATGEWTPAKNMGDVLNNKGPNFISSITPDGNAVLLLLGNEYRNNKMRAGVSMSSKDGESWTEPQALEIEDGYNLSEHANFFMSNSRKFLLLSVEREDTRGDRDLYVSFSAGENKWSKPLNLGEVINTAQAESSPFLAADEKTLYFSTKGFSGYGGSDIFVTRRLDDTWQNWSEPENLGPSINSPQDDEFFNIPASGENAYYSQGITEDNLDIFQLQLPVFYRPAPVVLIKGKVYNSKTREPIEARILYEKLPEGIEVGEAQSDGETGEYKIILPSGAKYGYLAQADGFLSINANIDLNNLTEYKEIEKDLFLVPIEVGQTITMNNINFDFDKAVLKEESFPELNRIVKFLTDSPNISIEVRGHTDSVGPDAYNLNLSERRAQSVYTYFVEKGIDKERLSFRAFGETEPITTNATVEGRRQNRRVEFRIVKN